MRALLLVTLLALSSIFAQADLTFGSTRFVFADLAQARQVLATRDDFVQNLSPFDRAARVNSAKAVSEQEFLDFVQAAARVFNQEEVALISRNLRALEPKLKKLNLPWPEKTLLIKTTGQEEGNAPYTRGTAIILPQSRLESPSSLQEALCHELFHLLSRHDKTFKERLYPLIGFHKCQEITFPRNLVRITNPDAPKNDHWIEVKTDGRSVTVVPILFADPPQFAPGPGKTFFDHLKFKLLAVEKVPGQPHVTYDPNHPSLLDPASVTGFFEQIGRNTTYIIHPEEILAENFTLLILRPDSAQSPDLLARLRDALEQPIK